MAQLSRPYQIGLAAIALLGAVWVLAIRGHSSSSNGSASAPASVATTTTPSSAPSTSASSGSKSSGASAPGVAGLSRAVEKAHGAVATSEKNASQLNHKSEQASSASPSSSSSSPTTTSAPTTHSSAPTKAASKPSTSATTTKPAESTKSASGAAEHSGIPAPERAAEAALKKGDVVVLLFWDKRGTDDVAVHKAVRSLKGQSKLFTSEAAAGQVASYGTITRGIQVYGTPTILIVNGKGQTITLTGLQDAYAIRQAIAEARHS